ncbi:probable ATP-dependent RNA helicase DHX37 isoform X2 [Halichondria panicea]|uniref:probable ATP-dependent RNA helicase DHX37 isoform X2 n=1 Tax=Halichondria panicea TaxID=6063 RepID=UPI00312BA538
MAFRKRLGYNWKARKNPVKKASQEIVPKVELDDQTGSHPDDTNSLVLPSRKRVSSGADEECIPKRKKLSSKHRKRLQKIVESREKKAKRAVLLDSLSTLALPDSYMTFFHSSTSIGQSRKTNKQLRSTHPLPDTPTPYSEPVSHRRKNQRKRRKVREEKVQLNPRPPAVQVEEVNGDVVNEDVDTDEYCSDSSLEDSQSESEEAVKNKCEEASIILENGLIESSPPKHVDSTKELIKQCAQDDPEQTRCEEAIKTEKRPAVFIGLERDPDVQMARLSLPILGEEQIVMEAISQHPVVVLCGETGSGKTTQVPQFLYEAGYTCKMGGTSLIGITEPRRVAAVSMSKRVAMEMGLSTSVVSYQIRYEGNTTDQTRIKFMTDGVLLKEIERDFLLSRYSVIVIDEAHERSVFTDILIGLLSRIVPLRQKKGNPLKFVIMSATLRVEDFTTNPHLFSTPPPVISIESRQYPVTVHFNKRTPTDYQAEAYRKVCKIHRTLKTGNILVFVTGQREVHTLCRKLRQTFGGVGEVCEDDDDGSMPVEGVMVVRREGRSYRDMATRRREIDLNNYPILPLALEEVVGVANSDECYSGDEWSSEGSDDEGSCDPSHDSQLPLLVLPLYSLLAPQQQAKVFQTPPEGVRLCVVATNVAETSLTIPGVKYVVDTGFVKMRYYDKVTGVSTFKVGWTSKASANQRAGRAGRTEPGHCYRLYSSAVFHNEFTEFSCPEMTRRPVDDLVLQMKALGIAKVTNFPFPTPPAAKTITAAEDLLLKLGALDSPSPLMNEPPSINPLGRIMSHFPLAPRYAKMLALGGQGDCIQYVIALVAALSVREVFAEGGLHDDEQEDEKRKKRQDRVYSIRRSWAGHGECQLLGDLMVLLRGVGASEFAGCTPSVCESHGLRHKAMLEVRKLRQQLTNTVNAVCPSNRVYLDPKLAPPTQEQARCLRQIMLTGLGDHVARKIPTHSLDSEDKKRLRHAYQILKHSIMAMWVCGFLWTSVCSPGDNSIAST